MRRASGLTGLAKGAADLVFGTGTGTRSRVSGEIDALCYSGGMSQPAPPQPFLGPIFKPDAKPIIATGYVYTSEEIAIHGVKTHNAIDFDVPRGTRVVAPADGYYLATYGEVELHQNDQLRLLSLEQAQQGNPSNTDLRPPRESKEPWPIYFGSLVIQGWHRHSRYTQFAHMDWVDEAIPFYEPTKTENGDLQFNAILRAPVKEYPRKAVWLKAGTLLGLTGMTGCGWGKRCYDFAQLADDGRPDFRDADYTYYTSPHLHFMVFGRRSNGKARTPMTFWDPFGIYKDIRGGYPTGGQDTWGTVAKSLWL